MSRKRKSADLAEGCDSDSDYEPEVISQPAKRAMTPYFRRLARLHAVEQENEVLASEYCSKYEALKKLYVQRSVSKADQGAFYPIEKIRARNKKAVEGIYKAQRKGLCDQRVEFHLELDSASAMRITRRIAKLNVKIKKQVTESLNAFLKSELDRIDEEIEKISMRSAAAAVVESSAAPSLFDAPLLDEVRDELFSEKVSVEQLRHALRVLAEPVYLQAESVLVRVLEDLDVDEIELIFDPEYDPIQFAVLYGSLGQVTITVSEVLSKALENALDAMSDVDEEKDAFDALAAGVAERIDPVSLDDLNVGSDAGVGAPPVSPSLEVGSLGSSSFFSQPRAAVVEAADAVDPSISDAMTDVDDVFDSSNGGVWHG
ncbi:MAG: hypothetical protein P1U63_12745 [Coxiellaceae bacterium]|nr:hypothetical protein [Coxiellaceae bacterium]